MQLVRENQGEPMELQVVRHQETIKLEMTPVETEDGSYKLGIWVRDNIQGIGTLTYVEPDGTFGALGHGSVTQTREKGWKYPTVIFTVQIFFPSVKVRPVHRGNFGA